jgi:predicted Rossmann-fold nucleotide-binding protein
MRAVVTGGRNNYSLRTQQELALRFAYELGTRKVAILHHGGAPGIDTDAGHIACKALGLTVREYRPDWDLHKKAAGPIRNQIMLRTADVLFAFLGGTGTADCTRQASRMNVPIIYMQGQGYLEI